ncbi:MAG: hypothetical protein R3D89_04430 [Sphingomonadaceae bacterium]
MAFAAAISLGSLNGTDGFRLDGIDFDDRSGYSVSGAGDINGDGFADVIIGAHGADQPGKLWVGESYVVFGKASGFAASISLASLNGSDGFRLDGIDAEDQSGYSVSAAGDVNGDGYDDIIIGAQSADPGGDSNAGESYVLFGKASGFAASIDLGALNGTDGFRLDGIDPTDLSGRSVSAAGDINGDGYGDIIFGAHFADPGGTTSAGESYVVFGKASGFAASIDLGALNGTDGFTLVGQNISDESGYSVAAAGDYNGDGYDDVIIGAPYANGSAGWSAVYFGKASGFAATVNLSGLNGSDGFRMDGVAANDESGWSVSGAGDVNGDGYDDIIIGARWADPAGIVNAGEAYLVFGKASGIAASFNLSTLNGNNGFRIAGINGSDFLGNAVSGAGDVNGDGYDDIVIGAYQGDPNSVSQSGESYVIFGKASGFAVTLDPSTLDGTDGFRLDGIDSSDYSGYSVSSAGDVNADGYDDIIIGAYQADPGGTTSAGESYVVFGRTINQTEGTPGNDDLAGGSGKDTLNGYAGRDTLFGDDGDDTLNGGPGEDRLDGGPGDDAMAGGEDNDVYVVAQAGDTVTETPTGGALDTVQAYFDYTLPDNVEILVMRGTAQEGMGNAGFNRIYGTAGKDSLFGLGDDDVLYGGAGQDSLYGGPGNDRLDGGPAKDGMEGGADDDIYIVNQADDTVFELSGEGIDSIYTYVDYTLPAHVENLILRGTAHNATGNAEANSLAGTSGSDVLTGLAGNDKLFGKSGNDTLLGGDNNDRLYGDRGQDTQTGGAGQDQFIFRETADSSNQIAFADLITDFSKTQFDKIVLTDIDADETNGAGTNEAFSFIGNAAAFTAPGQVRFEHVGGDTHVFGNTDADLFPEFAIVLTGTITLTSGDFIL